MKEGHDLVPDLGIRTHKHPVKAAGKRRPLSQQDAKPLQVVNVEAFLSGLPPVQVTPFYRTVFYQPLLLSVSQRIIDPVFVLPDGVSLILTYLEQKWFQLLAPFTHFSPFPQATSTLLDPAFLNILANGASIFDNPVLWNSGLTPTQNGEYSGFMERDVNLLNHGVGERTAVLISDGQAIEAEYILTFDTATGFRVPANPNPNAVELILKGFTIPSKVLKEAKVIFGI